MSVKRSTIAPAVAHVPGPFWLFPLGAVIGCVFFLLTAEEGSDLQQAFIGAMWGAFGAVPAVMVAGFATIVLRNRRDSALWRSHTPDWYRHSYPELALADGGVQCRFCGGERVQPRNIAGRLDVRAYTCGACGETLYYTRDRL